MNKECICLWVSKERPTDAQRDELKNSWGVTEIIEDVGVELASKRYSDKKPQNVIELADIDFKSEEDEKLFVKELCALVKETGAEVLAGDIHGGFNMYDSSEKVSVLRASKIVTAGEGVWPTVDYRVDHNFFIKSYAPFWAPLHYETTKVFKRNLLDTKFLHKVWSSWEFTKEGNKTWMVTRLRDDSRYVIGCMVLNNQEFNLEFCFEGKLPWVHYELADLGLSAHQELQVVTWVRSSYIDYYRRDK